MNWRSQGKYPPERHYFTCNYRSFCDQNWAGNNPTLHLLDDSKCTNAAFPKTSIGCIVWSAHCYLDRDNSGTHMNWTAEVEAGVTVRYASWPV